MSSTIEARNISKDDKTYGAIYQDDLTRHEKLKTGKFIIINYLYIFLMFISHKLIFCVI